MSEPAMVEVLLATYNGARFLRQQIDSVLAQQNVAVRILAHDDGSTDGTVHILNAYATAHPQTFHLLQDATRTGSAKGNFAHLLRASSAPYVAFCDQDDIWLPQKLSLSLKAMHALEATHSSTAPLLVYTDLRVVDESLNTVSESLWQSNNLRNAAHPTFAQLLTENVATGCTMLMNRPLATLAQSLPPAAQMHDHWISLLASGLGAMQAVAQATMLYRQHTANVIGAIAQQSSLTAKLQRFVSKEGIEDRGNQFQLDHAQAQALQQSHGDALPPQHRVTLTAFLALPHCGRLQRLRLVSQHGLWRPDTQRRIAQTLDLLR